MPDEHITAWRIVQSRYVDGADEEAGRGAFSGEGARLYGGRWNRPGLPVAYAAGSCSLALLEVLVNLGEPRLLKQYLLIPVAFDVEAVETVDELPDDWRAYPAPRSTQKYGDVWIREARSPVLQVPSVVVPAEWNYIVNPRHPGFVDLEIGAPEVLDVDERLTG